MINTKTTEREKRIIEEANRRQDTVLEEAKRKAEKKEKIILQKAQHDCEISTTKEIASEKLKARQSLIQAKGALIEGVIVAAEKAIKKRVKSKEYSRILADLAIEGGISLEGGDLVLVLPRGQDVDMDKSKIEKAITKSTGKKTSVKMAKEKVRASGGIIVKTADGKKWVDNTFEGRMLRLNDIIRRRITEILFKEQTEDS